MGLRGHHSDGYSAEIERRGAVVVVETPRELARLVPVQPLASPGVAPPERCDLCVPIMSGPALLKVVPAEVPYLFPDSVDVLEWGRRLGPATGVARVGLVWAGNPRQINDSNRSCRLADLSPLLSVPGVVFYSLQVGAASAQAVGSVLIDHTADLRDYADTAALVANLDVVISVDTSVAHLAGAMGKPVWTLLSFVPDFRWAHEREDTPWYPTMRLFRQPRPGDWHSVATRVWEELRRLVGQRSGIMAGACPAACSTS